MKDTEKTTAETLRQEREANAKVNAELVKIIDRQAEALEEATETIETLENLNEIYFDQTDEAEARAEEATTRAIRAEEENARFKRLNSMLLKAITESEQETNEATAEANKWKRLYLNALTNLDDTVKEIDILREHADSLRARTHSRKINLKKGA